MKREYKKAIEEARKRLADYEERKEGDEGILELIDSCLTEEEIAESEIRVAIISALVQARKEQGITQKQLEEISGIKQPMIARIERGTTVPNIETITKVLLPLGKKLAVVDA